MTEPPRRPCLFGFLYAWIPVCLCLSVCLCQPDGLGRIVYASTQKSVYVHWVCSPCLCARPTVRPTVYAWKKMTLGVCVYLLCMCVLWDHVCELAMAVPCVHGSATDLV